MKDIKVYETYIISRQPVEHHERRYACIEIPYPFEGLKPGQFLMIQAQLSNVNWAYPFLVQRVGAGACTVLATVSTRLYHAQIGCALTVIGPCGNPNTVEDTGMFMVLTEPACYFLTLPFFEKANGFTNLLWLGQEKYEPFWGERTKVESIVAVDQAVERALKIGGRLVVALNPPKLEPVVKALQQAKALDCLVFAPTKMGCGIGACRSCAMHSQQVRSGILTCCEGPYMPLSTFDFDTDRKCFITIE